RKLADAAKVIASEPMAMQLRFLQTLTTIAAENNSTTVFPLPIELIKPFLDAEKKARRR
ncbi:MAG: slipin family protein, partial [Candidatus Oleimicrobiaceae bacterium]